MKKHVKDLAFISYKQEDAEISCPLDPCPQKSSSHINRCPFPSVNEELSKQADNEKSNMHIFNNDM